MLRGALCGAIAAAIWEAQTPLDRRVFGVDYSDARLLGSAVTRGPTAFPIGVAMHIANGALFGAAYSRVAPSLPGPAVARGLAAGLGEHAATWPLMRFASLHPASKQLPQLWGSSAALAQATWRHALFGGVLGALEGRLNPPEAEAPREEEIEVSSNGHGKVERLAVPS
jgi:hypothetical protein